MQVDSDGSEITKVKKKKGLVFIQNVANS